MERIETVSVGRVISRGTGRAKNGYRFPRWAIATYSPHKKKNGEWVWKLVSSGCNQWGKAPEDVKGGSLQWVKVDPELLKRYDHSSEKVT